MRRWWPWLIAALAGAALVHAAVIHFMPRLIMRTAMARISAGTAVNHAFFAIRADETARTIVRPSPDLLYSICVFDVSERPLRVTASVPRDTYWSVSMFAANTDNFFKLNDHEAQAEHVEIVLARSGSGVDLPPGAMLVEPPTTRGIILTRTLISDENRLAELDTARREFNCAPL